MIIGEFKSYCNVGYFAGIDNEICHSLVWDDFLTDIKTALKEDKVIYLYNPAKDSADNMHLGIGYLPLTHKKISELKRRLNVDICYNCGIIVPNYEIHFNDSDYFSCNDCE